MTRYMFVSPSPVALQIPALPDLTALLAPGAPFTVWSSYFYGGTEYTATVTAPDGITPLVDANGNILCDANGQFPSFIAADDVTLVWLDFGTGTRVPILAAQAVEDVLAAYRDGSIGGGGTGGVITSGSITDAQPVGIAVLTAVDKQAGRVAIGAGTGNGTSDLVLGSNDPSKASPSTHAHSAGQVAITPITGSTAQNVQAALTDLSNRGTGGTTETYLNLYASGAYPTQPASPPPGTKVRQAFGPVQPTYATWPGVLDAYRYANLS